MSPSTYQPEFPLPPELLLETLEHLYVSLFFTTRWFANLRLVCKSWEPHVKSVLLTHIAIKLGGDSLKKLERSLLGEAHISEVNETEASDSSGSTYDYSSKSGTSVAAHNLSRIKLFTALDPLEPQTFLGGSPAPLLEGELIFRLAGMMPNLRDLVITVPNAGCALSPEFQFPHLKNLRMLVLAGNFSKKIDNPESSPILAGDNSDIVPPPTTPSLSPVIDFDPQIAFSMFGRISTLEDLIVKGITMLEPILVPETHQASFQLKHLQIEDCAFHSQNLSSFFSNSKNSLTSLTWTDNLTEDSRHVKEGEFVTMFSENLEMLMLAHTKEGYIHWPGVLKSISGGATSARTTSDGNPSSSAASSTGPKQAFPSFPRLKALELFPAQMDPEFLPFVQSFPSLKLIQLDLPMIPLSTISQFRIDFGYEGGELCPWRNLETIQLAGMKLDLDGLKFCFESSKDTLQRLDIGDSRLVTDYTSSPLNPFMANTMTTATDLDVMERNKALMMETIPRLWENVQILEIWSLANPSIEHLPDPFTAWAARLTDPPESNTTETKNDIKILDHLQTFFPNLKGLSIDSSACPIHEHSYPDSLEIVELMVEDVSSSDLEPSPLSSSLLSSPSTITSTSTSTPISTPSSVPGSTSASSATTPSTSGSDRKGKKRATQSQIESLKALGQLADAFDKGMLPSVRICVVFAIEPQSSQGLDDEDSSSSDQQQQQQPQNPAQQRQNLLPTQPGPRIPIAPPPPVPPLTAPPTPPNYPFIENLHPGSHERPWDALEQERGFLGKTAEFSRLREICVTKGVELILDISDQMFDELVRRLVGMKR